MIRQVGKSLSLEEALQKDLQKAREQALEIDQILCLDDKALENGFVLKAVKETLKQNKELLLRIAETGKAIEYWRQHPELYAEIRNRIKEDEKDRFENE